jgi:DNA modification methylase/predicted RNA-binding Zn-ribbon protein involved in translation (DUF1610 family)
MEPRKLTKEDIDKVRHIEGFPIGSDEDIFALSDAPYYTACPNPFINEFIKENGTVYNESTDEYQREPFTADVSEGKNDPIYGSHNYHTKVPPKAIMRYLLHYTNPGDIVLDGFSGSGMTGVAAKKCSNPDPAFKMQIEKEMPYVKWGNRKAILNDLSPAATFITFGHNINVDSRWYIEHAKKVLENSEREYDWIYKTTHHEFSNDGQLSFETGSKKGIINYTVWSDVFICPTCGEEIVFTDVQQTSSNLKDAFICPSCSRRLKKNDCERAKVIIYDEFLQTTTEITKQIPVLINYTYGGKKYDKKPDAEDLELINKIANMPMPYRIPILKLPDGYNTDQPRKSHGVEYLHQFYTRRNLYAISVIYNNLAKYQTPERQILTFTFEQILMGMSKIARYVPSHYSQVNQYLSGTLYIASQVVEVSPRYILDNKIKLLGNVYGQNAIREKNVIISTGSTTNLPINDSVIDYIFTDPPFGANLNYSELSFMWEAWYGVLTNNKTEAIMNPVQGKGLIEYQSLMTECFKEYYRVLKPNRWMTVEFHNSKNAVWNAIQEALLRAGFIIADVRTLDKKQGSFKQVVSDKAVKQDLVISVYKPKKQFEREFEEKAGTEETAWAFVRQHLSNIPVVVVRGGKIEIISERQDYLLFDRMVAYHIMQGIPVPLDATDFYKGLDDKFLKRDNMYFLPDQVNEYDTARIKNDVEPIQFSLFVTNEKTAIAWLYQQLDVPQTYAELQPKFMQEVKSVDRYEEMPELAVLLEENFLQDDKGRWYIPDITKEGDVAKLREKKLWKEFEGYLNSTGKLKLFRSEAIRVGFSRLWKDKNYQAIVDIAERLPEQTIQEDPNLLMYYDISTSRI